MKDIEVSVFKAAWDAADSPAEAASRLGLTLDDTLWWEWHFRSREGVPLKVFPAPPDDERALLTAEEAAQTLGVSHKRVVRLLGAGELQGGKDGRTYFIYADSIEDYRRRHSPRLIVKVLNPQEEMSDEAVEAWYGVMEQAMAMDPDWARKTATQEGGA